MIYKQTIWGVLTVLSMSCSLYGCGSSHVEQPEKTVVENTEDTLSVTDVETSAASNAQEVLQDAQSGEDLDVVEPSPADDTWYMKGNIYTDDNGRRLEVFFDDEGMLEFAVDGLSLYYTAVDRYQQENNWKVYTCDDGTIIIYYPGTPAHLEISDGEYAVLYEAGGDKVK